MLHPQGVRGRSELGELLYQFKYRNDRTALTKMLQVCNHYLARRATGKFEIVVPVPPSNPARIVTKCIAQGIAAGLGVTYSATALMKVKSTSALKSVIDPEVRKALLRDAFQVDKKQIEGKATQRCWLMTCTGPELHSSARPRPSLVKVFLRQSTFWR